MPVKKRVESADSAFIITVSDAGAPPTPDQSPLLLAVRVRRAALPATLWPFAGTAQIIIHNISAAYKQIVRANFRLSALSASPRVR